MALTPNQLRLYLVTDPALCAKAGLVETVMAAIQGGVTFVQLRNKDATTAVRVDQARALKQAMVGTGVPLVVNDDVQAAVAAGVDGVHVGQGDVPIAQARQMIGADRILGLSCESVADVIAAKDAPVDYLGLGTVFGTATKADTKPLIGLDGLAQMSQASDFPTVAIGGLKADHNDAVLATGTDGLAVVSAICGQDDPTAAAQRFFVNESET